MSNGIEIEGMEDFTKLLQNMNLTPEDETKAMRKALEIPFKETKDNAPVFKEFTKKSIKKYVKKDGMATVGIIRVNGWDAVFSEFGSSKDKSHVGWFSNSIDRTNNSFLKKLSEELLSKAK